MLPRQTLIPSLASPLNYKLQQNRMNALVRCWIPPKPESDDSISENEDEEIFQSDLRAAVTISLIQPVHWREPADHDQAKPMQNLMAGDKGLPAHHPLHNARSLQNLPIVIASQ